MASPQLPLVDDVMAAGTAYLLSRRPELARHLANPKSGFSKVLAGWRGQMQLTRRRLAKEALAARLPFARGRELLELAQGRFEVDEVPGVRRAIGSVHLIRVHVSPVQIEVPFRAGVIPAGARFSRRVDLEASPQLTACEYISREAVHAGAQGDEIPLPGGGFAYTQIVEVPIEALVEGPGGNVLQLAGGMGYEPPIRPSDRLFDPAFMVGYAEAAGGSSGPSDGSIRAIARAMSTGRHGATDSALIVGALLDSGVRRVAISRDAEHGTSIVHVADESWAYSAALLREAQQRLSDTWEGFGCIAALQGIVGARIDLRLHVRLASESYLADTAAIRRAIYSTARAYFDDRPDFWTLRRTALAADVCAAHPRIQTVDALTIYDVEGREISDLDIANLEASAPNLRWRFYLPPGAISIEFAA